VLATLLETATAGAQEDNDLKNIPGAVQSQTVPTAEQQAAQDATSLSRTLFFEDVLSANSNRDFLIIPLPENPDWQNRLSADLRAQMELSDTVRLSLSDRLSWDEGEAVPPMAQSSAGNDLREASLTWQFEPQQFVEFGRVNLREGVALGYSPTDFFRTGTSVVEASADPTVTRAGRLGTVMAQYQYLWTDGSLSLVFSPKLGGPNLDGSGDLTFNPQFGSTNGSTRFLAALSFPAFDLSPQAEILVSGKSPRFGLSLSHLVSSGIVAYAEWAGGQQESLLGETASYEIQKGFLTDPSQFAIPTTTQQRFRNDATVGASWSDGASGLTVNLEYHFHEAGLSDGEWSAYFNAGAAGTPQILRDLETVRAMAANDQDPTGRQEIFLRTDWSDAFVKNLDLDIVVLTDLHGASSGAQASAVYDISNKWTVGTYVTTTFGSRRSEYGSVRLDLSAALQVKRFF
jgi:hypothetical protein